MPPIDLPKSRDVTRNAALQRTAQNEHRAAIEELQALLKTNPEDLSARLFLAKELLNAERGNEALREFLRVAQADPDNDEAVLQADTLLSHTKQYANALNLLEKSHTRNPQKTDTAATLAYLLAASPQNDLRAGARALPLAPGGLSNDGTSAARPIVALAWLNSAVAQRLQIGSAG